mgnify:CR=1 FL=1
MFSDSDTFKFLELVKNAQTNNIPIKNVYSVMVSSYGTYTLRFTGNPNDIDLTKFDTPRKKYKYRLLYEKKFKKHGNKERAYLHFLKEALNLRGLHFHEVKRDGEEVKKLTLKPNGKVNSEDCE